MGLLTHRFIKKLNPIGVAPLELGPLFDEDFFETICFH
jgi:hypothetical protein